MSNDTMKICLGLSLLLTASPLAAQTTWIVDAANGAGTHFTDLPAAEGVATHGDTLIVRAGRYSNLVTSKGLTILGTRGQTLLQGPTTATPAIWVENLPAGRRFAAYGLVVLAQGLDPGYVVLRNNPSHVHIEGLECSGPTYPSSSVVLTTSNCGAVTVFDCGQQSDVSINTHNSAVSIVHCRLRGVGALNDPRAGFRVARPALAIDGSTVEVADCSLIGGHGSSSFVFGQRASAPGVLMGVFASARLRVRAGALAEVRAGTGPGTSMPMPAIDGTGEAHLDPSVQLVPFALAPAIAVGVTANESPTPGLSLAGGALGAALVATHHGEAHRPCLLMAGPIAAVIPLAFGDLYLDPLALVIAPALRADAAGIATLTFVLPANPALAGEPLPWQAVSVIGNELALSNPTAVLLR